jgi:hypothetical protein
VEDTDQESPFSRNREGRAKVGEAQLYGGSETRAARNEQEMFIISEKQKSEAFLRSLLRTT